MAQAIAESGVLVISIVAGMRTHDIDRWLGDKNPVVRAMPNTPALVQCSATALYANSHTTASQKDTAESVMRATGLTLWVENEALMDVVTALSGSGPAYFFRIMESLVNAGTELGLSPDQARILTLQTALGAAKLAMESSETINVLREGVTSPGGTTEQGLKVLAEYDIDTIIDKVVKAAHRRSIELADMLGES